MKVKIDKKYIVLPLGYQAVIKKVAFYQDGKLTFDIDAAIDVLEPDYTQCLNMERFFGLDLEIQCSGISDITFEQIDEPLSDGEYKEKYRPQIQFSAKKGWINDPNGLVYYNGVYHLFFQHNPAGAKWGNMHWGHAVSKDLLHWEEMDCALYPDELGTMYSGSAIVDIENVSGLQENDHPALLLFYTAAGGMSQLSQNKGYSQCLAYSTDGGHTFKKYSANPIIPQFIHGNRDPKVIFCEELNEYIMALYLEENKYALYSSKNLIHWKLKQEIILPGDTECPDFFPLPLDENLNNQKWVFMGAAGRYLVGEMKEGQFESVQPVKSVQYGKSDGRSSYAGQTFSDIPSWDGRRIRMAWNTMEIPYSPFNCAMCFSQEAKLSTINGEPHICLSPVQEIKDLIADTNIFTDFNLTQAHSLAAPLKGKAQDIQLQIAVENNSVFSICFYGLEMVCKVEEDQLQLFQFTMPLYVKNGTMHLRLLVDTVGVEIFIDKGQAYMCTGFLCDYNLNEFSIKSHRGEANIIQCVLSQLKSIWE